MNFDCTGVITKISKQLPQHSRILRHMPGLSSQIRCFERHRSPSEVVETYAREDVCSVFMPLTRGGAVVSRGGNNLYSGELRPGMLRLTVPMERSRAVYFSPVSLIELVVPGDTLRRYFHEAGFLWPAGEARFTPLVTPRQTIACLAAAFQGAAKLDPQQRPDYLEGLTQALFACLIESQHFKLPTNERVSSKPLGDSAFVRCSEFADARLGGRLRLHEWAAVVDMNVSEFARAFRKRTSQSPYAWLLNRRVDYAKRLLQQENFSLAEVALRAGFYSQSHFTEAFRRRVGCPPARWLHTCKTNGQKPACAGF
jgi:AraC family transcriptional regulator